MIDWPVEAAHSELPKLPPMKLLNAGLPLLKTMCATCPFRPGSPYAHLVPTIAETLTETSRICHSTGSDNAIHQHTGEPAAICRGARDIQLKLLHALGFLETPTDEAWDAAHAELQRLKKS